MSGMGEIKNFEPGLDSEKFGAPTARTAGRPATAPVAAGVTAAAMSAIEEADAMRPIEVATAEEFFAALKQRKHNDANPRRITITQENLDLSVAWPTNHGNLRNIDFNGAEMEKCDLRDNYLDGSDLSRVSLIGANLSGVRARNANFSHAYPIGAVLVDAVLDGSDFSWANLISARVSRGTSMQWAIFHATRRDWVVTSSEGRREKVDAFTVEAWLGVVHQSA